MSKQDKRVGRRSDLSVMCSVKQMDEGEFLEVFNRHPIPGAILDSRYDVTINQVEDVLNSKGGVLSGMDAELVGFLKLIIRYQRHQERLIRHLVIDSRGLHPCVINISISGVCLSAIDRKVAVDDTVHFQVLFPNMMIPLSIPCVVSRVDDAGGEVAMRFVYRSENERISLSRYISSVLIRG